MKQTATAINICSAHKSQPDMKTTAQENIAPARKAEAVILGISQSVSQNNAPARKAVAVVLGISQCQSPDGQSAALHKTARSDLARLVGVCLWEPTCSRLQLSDMDCSCCAVRPAELPLSLHRPASAAALWSQRAAGDHSTAALRFWATLAGHEAQSVPLLMLPKHDSTENITAFSIAYL